MAYANLYPNVVQVNPKIWSRLKLQSVEMEAVTVVPVTLITIYDVCKAVNRGMVMSNYLRKAIVNLESGRRPSGHQLVSLS